MARRTVRRRPREEREADILRAARSVFSERGFDGASIAEIARRAGVVEGTIYKYYVNKRDLLFKLMVKVYDALTAGAQARILKVSGTREQLRFLIWWHLNAFIDDPGLCRLFIREIRSDDDYYRSAIHDANKRYTAILLRVLQKGMEKGDLRPDISPPMVRDMVYGSIEHISWAWVAGHGSLHIDRVADDLADAILGGIAAHGRNAPTMDGTVRRLERLVERMEGTVAAGDRSREARG